MKNNKFTKGPWAVCFDKVTVVKNCGRNGIKTLVMPNIPPLKFGMEVSPFESEWEANANLIAAAPEMYELLRRIELETMDSNIELWKDILKVLKKARGES